MSGSFPPRARSVTHNRTWSCLLRLAFLLPTQYASQLGAPAPPTLGATLCRHRRQPRLARHPRRSPAPPPPPVWHGGIICPEISGDANVGPTSDSCTYARSDSADRAATASSTQSPLRFLSRPGDDCATGSTALRANHQPRLEDQPVGDHGVVPGGGYSWISKSF